MLDKAVSVITGQKHLDERGEVAFVNDFDMKDVRRFYRVRNSKQNLKRGWRGHKIEQRWVSVLSGSFKISVVKIDNWDNPSKNLIVQHYFLENDCAVLHIPSGFATCLEALEYGSEIILFTDYLIDNAAQDNYLYPLNYFDN